MTPTLRRYHRPVDRDVEKMLVHLKAKLRVSAVFLLFNRELAP